MASTAMERLKQYNAGKELVQLLADSVQPKDVADRVATLAARVADEALRKGGGSGGVDQGPAAKGGAATANGTSGAAAAEQQHDFSAATAVLQGVSMTVPWGKHDIGFGPEHLLLRGSQRVVAIPYSAIEHVAILEQIPKEPKDKNCVVLALRRDSDVRAGKARLDVVVAQTKANPHVKVPMPPGCELLSEGPTIDGPAAVVLCQLLGAHLTDIQEDTFTSSDPAVFKTASGDLAVSANVRTASGWLFPLPGALLFLGKPAHFIRHSELVGLEFSRVGAASSTFDVAARLAGGGRVEFGQIDQGELLRLQAYVAERRLAVGDGGDDAAPSGKRPKGGAAAAGAGGAGGGGEEDEEDASDDEDSDFDPSAADEAEPSGKRRRTGGAGEAGGSGQQAASEDGGSSDGEDEEEDEDEDEDDDSSDVSLVNTDEMSEDSGGGDAGPPFDD